MRLFIARIGDGANSTSSINTIYDRLYFLPPANCVGKGLILSFDILNFNREDAPTASMILDRAGAVLKTRRVCGFQDSYAYGVLVQGTRTAEREKH